MLLAISNDLSLRTLKTRRWKSLQRWAYVAFVLTAAHGIAYQSIEKRRVPWVLVFSGSRSQLVLVKSLALSRFNGG
jgi:methionine sulfoxide reductase heme-binding subunit